MPYATTPVLCIYDYLGVEGEDRGRPCWYSGSIMVEVRSETRDEVLAAFERAMKHRRATHQPWDIGPRPQQWRLKSVLTPDHVERHH
jgi:hypothetical protein